MIKKLANVFLLSGLLLVVIYFVSPSLGLDEIYFCLGGMGLLFFSFLINWVGRKRPSEPRRFRTFRKLFGESTEEERER